MDDLELAKNLLLNHTCDNCSKRFTSIVAKSYGWCYAQSGLKKPPKEKTCRWWKSNLE